MKKILVSVITMYASICCSAQNTIQNTLPKEYSFSAGVSVGYDLGSYFPGHKAGFDIFGEAEYIF